jgi:diacylglycerol kinase family enzyme
VRDRGLLSCTLSFAGLGEDLRLIIPANDGFSVTRDTVGTNWTYGARWPQNWEAALLIAEGAKGCLGMWADEPALRYGRSLGITRDPSDIADVVAAGRTMLHDVGFIDFPEASGTRRWFINVAGAGYDAWVSERVPRPVPSAFTYLRVALNGLASYRSPEFHITAGNETIAGRLLLAFVANARFCGNRMPVAPTASMDDGLLDVLAVHELSLLQVLPKLVKLYRGRILGDRAVRHLRASTVRIETSPSVAVQADGQIVGRTPAEFGVQRQALRVAIP